MLVRQLPGLLTFRIKLLFLSQPLLSLFIGPLSGKLYELGLCNNISIITLLTAFPLYRAEHSEKSLLWLVCWLLLRYWYPCLLNSWTCWFFFFFLCHIWAFFWRYESCLRVTGTLGSHPFQNLTIICVWYNKTGDKWIPFVETANTYNPPYPLKFSKILPFYPFLLPSQEPSKISSVQVNFYLYKST